MNTATSFIVLLFFGFILSLTVFRGYYTRDLKISRDVLLFAFLQMAMATCVGLICGYMY